MGNADNGAVGTATDPPSSATPAKKIKKSSAAASNKSNKKHAGSGANGTRLSSHLMQDSSTTSCSSSSTSSTAEDDNSNNNATTVISSADRMLLTFMDSDSEEATKTHTATGFLHRSYRSQAAGNTRRVTPQPQQQSGDGKLVLVEKALPNGDIYSGYFSAGGHVPHGTGKYLWADGCMYEGEWRRGKAAGKGKFSWPSGATFEGHFRSGRMEGYGTFTGPEGDTYRGDWVADRKHGKGEKRYANGDFYEGEWRRNLQEGQGRYVWRNGNQYVGEWKNGLISGRGVLIWANGNRYDGQWEDGVPKGSGVFTWPDGSCYVVSSLPSSAQPDDLKPDHFVHGLPQLHGTFYPSTTPANAINHTNPSAVSSPFMPPSIPPNNNRWTNHFLPQASQSSVYPLPPDSPTTTNTNHRLSSPGKCMPPESFQGRGSHAAGSEKTFPRICIWESDGAAGDITCDIIDTVEASMLYKDGVGSKIVTAAAAAVGFQQGAQTPPCKSPRAFIGTEVKKPGQAISKGHRHYDLMRNLQLGISYSVGKPLSSGDMRDLKQSDFNPKEKYWTKFPPEGSKTTPPHQSSDFRWKDYCPRVFRHLRKLFAIDPADYMLAICGNEALRELSSPGKSGSFFYLTQDDRFMIKTVKKSEVKVLIRMLPSYYAHVSQHKNTLVTKFFGVHCVKPVGGQKVRFTVMGNVFCSEYRIHRRFDLKGSSHGRTVQKPDGDIDETTTLKDLDLNFVFRLQQSWFQDLISQINRDCEFLERERIMDYSLLIGLHFRDDVSASNNGRSSTASPGYHPFADGLPDIRKPVARLGAGMPARAELILRNELDCYVSSRGSGAPRQRSEVYDVVLYFGIIDILQDYDISKKLEHAYKSLQVDPCSISAVDPRLYSKRFREFIGRVFVEDR